MFEFGLMILFIGQLWFVIDAFRTSLLWGFGCLFLAPVSIAYLFMHWDGAKAPFIVILIGAGLTALGAS